MGNGLIVLHFFLAVLAESLNACAVGAPFAPGDLIRSGF